MALLAGKSVASRTVRGGAAARRVSVPLKNLRPLQASPIEVGLSVVDAVPSELVAATADGSETSLLVAGVAAAAAVVGAAVYAVTGQGKDSAGATATNSGSASMARPAGPPAPPRENAVMVLGATGRLGRRVVQRLLKAGRTVVAATRSAETAEATLTGPEVGLKSGYQEDGSGILFFESVDVRDPESLRRPELWAGVSQVVLVLAGKAGMRPDGQFGYFDGLTPEDIEAKGIVNTVGVLRDLLPRAEVQSTTVLPMGTEAEVAMWDEMDDRIMGGVSVSKIKAAPDVGPGVARWTGDLIVEGGGFCGARTKTLTNTAYLADYDGISLRVKGDGSIFKLNIKTTDQLDAPESTYQTTFDTVAGQWADVRLPWHSFVPVKRAQSDPKGAPLDPSKVAKFGLVLSRFEFNKAPNPVYTPGPFELLIDGGIRAYKDVRPQVVQLSSAGVERNAIIGDDAEARKKDVPIVQLNPGGVLNHKYAAEIAVRASGLPYTVVRSTGMVDTNENGPFQLEASQGDRISGSVGRDDIADVLVQALTTPEAAYKTFEVRRSEALDGRGKAMSDGDYTRLFCTLAMDRHRWRVGLQPFPAYAPPPAAPVSEERVQEIKRDIAAVRTQFKEKGMGVQEEAGAPPPPPPPAGEQAKEREVVSAGSR